MNLNCATCNGRAIVRAPFEKTCPDCNGTGLRKQTPALVVAAHEGRIVITAGAHEISLSAVEVPAFVAAVLATADAIEDAA